MQTRSTVVGVFDDRDDAQRAIEALKDAGLRGDDIGVTMRDRGDTKEMAEDTGAHAGAGAATGALAGGALGGVAGWLVGIGALAIPGIGPIVAAGPLAAALGGAAIGAAGGGLLGALTGMGVPEEEARWYEGEVGQGAILVTAQAEGQYEEVRRIMRRYGAREAGAADEVAEGGLAGTERDGGMDRGRRSDDARETAGTVGGGLAAGAAGAAVGGAVGGPPGAVAGAALGGAAGAAGGHELTEDKELEHRGEGRERGGTGPGSGAGRDWSGVSDNFRGDWQSRHGASGRTWEQDEPGYRYGWESANDPRYRGREWHEVEADLGRDWGSRHGAHGRWEDVRDRSREAWEYGRRPFTGAAGARTEDRDTVQLREEELRADTELRQTGEVEVRKEVREEQRSIDVPVTREEVVVERHPVDRRPDDRPLGEGETLRVPVREERVEVEKTPVVTEEIEVGKRTVQDTERVTDTVRREEAVIDREGDVDVEGDPGTRLDRPRP